MPNRLYKKRDGPKVEVSELEERPAEKPVIKPEEKPAEKSTVFIPNLNIASTSVKIPSLKDLGKTALQETVEDDPYLKGTDFEDFDAETFIKTWNAYAAKSQSRR